MTATLWALAFAFTLLSALGLALMCWWATDDDYKPPLLWLGSLACYAGAWTIYVRWLT